MILVFGANGQLGRSLKDTAPADLGITFVDRSLCDLSQRGDVKQCLEAHQPQIIINAAAYTAVDRAEEERELAHQINATAVEEMAKWISDQSASQSEDPSASSQPQLIHISTDFVFNGTSTTPYKPGDPTSPLGEYGQSKLAGEVAVLEAAPESAMIIRTAWVYSEHGNNFVKTMLRLMGEKDELGVVSDQRGSPTYARGLAEVIWRIVAEELFEPGIYHWTDAGDITWHEFAAAIQEAGLEADLLKRPIPVNPITTADYPTPAERPAYSVLANSKLAARLGIDPTPWQENLQQMLSYLQRVD